MIRCGKAAGACADNPKTRHGPYHSLTQAVGGKTRSRFLTDEKAAVAERQIAAGREFLQQVDTYWEACEEWADAQLEPELDASSGEAEKRGSGLILGQVSAGARQLRTRMIGDVGVRPLLQRWCD